ncbi:class I SAM-dependent methyltransferase [Sulfitobacter guttiformis]|uniref:Methyltransferase family protein n=1 Tax=Sulfitobacter guttiformis TaxID=74349 RepID=A0A420DIX2_9RHOB|nr:class I SAM-dependent methyltransferase [Sulfitobacter guttiformis]KIN72051.1 Methyltransferase [Sulfitobacter guttiformis KCTC 32187]RKE94169.1 methyltransferase family protein [Sulfitobacter guttiformis]
MHFTRGKPAMVRAAALAFRRLKYAVVAPVVSGVMARTSWLDGTDAPPKALNYAADGDFISQGDELVVALRRDFTLGEGVRILDIGCGIGRIATALRRAGSDVRYSGFDIVKYGILWCQKKLSERDGYHFTHADIFNPFYNPRGRIDPCAYVFPYPDKSFDLLIAVSVYTHLLEAETRAYFAQSMRVMDSTGKAYFTTFLVDDDIPPQAHFAFQHRIGAAFIERMEEPEMAVGYSLAFWEALAAQHGARISKVNPGSWRGQQGLKDYQDCLIFEKVEQT